MCCSTSSRRTSTPTSQGARARPFTPWLTDYVLGDHFTDGDRSSLAAVAGYPGITVPAGFVCGLPVGITFFAGACAKPALIRLAYTFEQATLVRRPPDFRLAVEIA